MIASTATLTPSTPHAVAAVVAAQAAAAPQAWTRPGLRAIDTSQASPAHVAATVVALAPAPQLMQSPLVLNFGTVSKEKTATVAVWNTSPAVASVVRSDFTGLPELTLNPSTLYIAPTAAATTSVVFKAVNRFKVSDQCTLANTLKIVATTGVLPAFEARVVATRYSFETKISEALDGTESRTGLFDAPREQLVVEATADMPGAILEALKRLGRRPILVANGADAQVATVAAGAIDLAHGYWLLETPGLGDGSRVAVKDATGTTWTAGAPAAGKYRAAPLVAVKVDAIEGVQAENSRTTVRLICSIQ